MGSGQILQGRVESIAAGIEDRDRSAGASLGTLAASSVTYIPPIVALVIGIFVGGEQINVLEYVAMLFVLIGVAVLQVGKRTVGSSSS
jgi:EamA domain-containing membrane protein RarD